MNLLSTFLSYIFLFVSCYEVKHLEVFEYWWEDDEIAMSFLVGEDL